MYKVFLIKNKDLVNLFKFILFGLVFDILIYLCFFIKNLKLVYFGYLALGSNFQNLLVFVGYYIATN